MHPTRRSFLTASLGAPAVLAGGTAPSDRIRVGLIGAFAQPATVNVADFGARAGDGSDTTPAVWAALEACRKTRARRLVFAPGRYHFRPDRAFEKYLHISNNDEGLKRIAFPLTGVENLEIDGQGAEFVFHGYISPFLVERSRSITLKNFSIDWKRTFHSEARVLASRENGVDVSIAEEFPYRVENGLLVFTGEDKELYPANGLLEFDPAKRETAYMAQDYWTGPNIRVEAIGARQLRLLVPKLKATPGHALVFGAAHRLHPAITISDSAGIRISGVNLYHCGGMGVIAQRSRDIDLDHVRVTPPPGSGRVVSLTADATHFSNCTGRITMIDCLFENQMDDAANIHGIYAQVTRKISAREVEVKLAHPQQFGFDFIEPGRRLELVHSASLITYGEAVVERVERLNKEYTRVVFAGTLPAELTEKDVVAALDYPEVTIRRCTIRGNRARGVLLGSRGRMLLEDNLFHTPGAAILLEGDGSFWFEQAGVRDLTVRGNRFENCNFGIWGRAAIETGAGIQPEFRGQSRYNRNILVENNLFRRFDGTPMVSIYSVDGLAVRNNRVERTDEYPAKNQGGEPFDVQHSSGVAIQGNQGE